VPTAVANLLPLPDLTGLTDQQQRGSACTFDGRHTSLTATTAVDLGEQTTGGITLFLRACKACTQAQALHTLQTHSGTCEQCVDDYTQCPTGVGLVRLVRETRR
jgi:hypothetical protein